MRPDFTGKFPRLRVFLMVRLVGADLPAGANSAAFAAPVSTPFIRFQSGPVTSRRWWGRNRRATIFTSRRSLVLALGAFVLLGGCTARWQAPLETREQRIPVIDPQTEFYRVKRGDTLAAIAWGAGTDWRKLAAWNKLRSPYTIVPGQIIRLRAPSRINLATRPRRVKPEPKRQTRKPVAKPKPIPAKPKSKPAIRKALRWAWPTSGEVLAVVSQKDTINKGVQIRGKLGQFIRAAESGHVVYSGSGLIGYGRLIILKHNDKYLSAYGHNRKILVKEGEQVTKGDRIAEMGASNGGRPLLHFEIRRDGKPVDPLKLLPRNR